MPSRPASAGSLDYPPTPNFLDDSTSSEETFAVRSSENAGNPWRSTLFQVQSFNTNGSTMTESNCTNAATINEVEWVSVSYLTDCAKRSSKDSSFLDDEMPLGHDSARAINPKCNRATVSEETVEVCDAFETRVLVEHPIVTEVPVFVVAKASKPKILKCKQVPTLRGKDTEETEWSFPKRRQKVCRKCGALCKHSTVSKTSGVGDAPILKVPIQGILNRHLSRCKINKSIATIHRYVLVQHNIYLIPKSNVVASPNLLDMQRYHQFCQSHLTMPFQQHWPQFFP